MKLNFKKITVTDLDGETVSVDISKSFGNFLYQNTGDLGMLEVAQEMYKKGEVELDDKARGEILTILKHPQCSFLAIVKKALIDILEKDEKKK